VVYCVYLSVAIVAFLHQSMTVTTRSDTVTMDLTQLAVGSFCEFMTVLLNILTSIRGDLNDIENVTGLNRMQTLLPQPIQHTIMSVNDNASLDYVSLNQKVSH
jgi:hypothetical protein